MQNNNANTAMPMGTIQGTVNLNEVSSSSRVKRSGVQLLNHGVNLGVIYGLVDLGTHMTSFKGEAPKEQRKLKIMFEHPQLKQLFYEDDNVPRSSASSKDCTFSINEKSFLKILIDAVVGQTQSVENAVKYNVAELIGKRVGVNIAHTPKKDNPTVFYENVVGVMSANGLAVPHPFEPENKPQFFFIDNAGNNFMTQNFADLPKYFRDKIKESKEGKAYANRGGKFAENPKQENGQQQQGQRVQQPQANAAPVTMTATAQYTREQYHASNWSDQQLVDAGFAVWNAPVQPAAPSGPQQPQAPVSTSPIAMTALAQFTREQYHASNWTDEQLVQQGLAIWVQSGQPVQQPLPAQPQGPPAAPSGPQQPQQPQMAAQAPPSFLDNGEEHDDLPF